MVNARKARISGLFVVFALVGTTLVFLMPGQQLVLSGIFGMIQGWALCQLLESSGQDTSFRVRVRMALIAWLVLFPAFLLVVCAGIAFLT